MRLYNANTQQREEVKQKDLKDALERGCVPSVTTILSLLCENNNLTKYMIENAVKKFIETQDYKTSVNFEDKTASEFGTVCHNLLESYVYNEEPKDEYNDYHLKTIEPMKRWIDNNVKEVVFMEHFFADLELGYGGSADFLFELKDGGLLLGDLKVKKDGPDLRFTKVGLDFRLKPTLGYRMQLSAYRKHFEKIYGKMEIGNFLLASPIENKRKSDGIINNIIVDKEARLAPFVYYGKDYYRQFNNLLEMWKAVNGVYED